MFSQYCDVFHNAVPTLEEHAESIVVTSHRRGNALSPMLFWGFRLLSLTVQETPQGFPSDTASEYSTVAWISPRSVVLDVRQTRCWGCSLLARHSTAYCLERHPGPRLALGRALRCPRIEGWSKWNSVLFRGGSSGWWSRFSLWLASSWLWGFSSAGDGARVRFWSQAIHGRVTGPLPPESSERMAGRDKCTLPIWTGIIVATSRFYSTTTAFR